MTVPSLTARIVFALCVITAVASTVVAVSTSASAATCAAVDVVFARGTGEAAGLGSVGGPFVSSLTSDLSGRSVSSYAVNYAASADQSSAGPGGTDLSNHVTSTAAACPNTRFVLGGYSQGASVVDVALGIQTGGTAIPTSLAGRVAAVVVFGNPLGLRGKTIATASTLYGPKSKDYCNTGDPVCGGGSNVAAHLQYVSNGSTTAGAQFAAGLVTKGSTPPVTPSPPAAACYTASTSNQIAAGRANQIFALAYAKGTNDYLGPASTSVIVSLTQVSTGSWHLVASC